MLLVYTHYVEIIRLEGREWDRHIGSSCSKHGL